jgi:hypothetical protein
MRDQTRQPQLFFVLVPLCFMQQAVGRRVSSEGEWVFQTAVNLGGMMSKKHDYVLSNSVLRNYGFLAGCSKCDRPILVEVFLFDPRSAPEISATCLDCLVLGEKFLEQSPREAAKLQAWKDEFGAKPEE